MFAHFRSITEIIYGVGDTVSILEGWHLYGFCKVYNLVFVHPKSMKLDEMANLNVIFSCGGLSIA